MEYPKLDTMDNSVVETIESDTFNNSNDKSCRSTRKKKTCKIIAYKCPECKYKNLNKCQVDAHKSKAHQAKTIGLKPRITQTNVLTLPMLCEELAQNSPQISLTSAEQFNKPTEIKVNPEVIVKEHSYALHLFKIPYSEASVVTKVTILEDVEEIDLTDSPINSPGELLVEETKLYGCDSELTTEQIVEKEDKDIEEEGEESINESRCSLSKNDVKENRKEAVICLPKLEHTLLIHKFINLKPAVCLTRWEECPSLVRLVKGNSNMSNRQNNEKASKSKIKSHEISEENLPKTEKVVHRKRSRIEVSAKREEGSNKKQSKKVESKKSVNRKTERTTRKEQSNKKIVQLAAEVPNQKHVMPKIRTIAKPEKEFQQTKEKELVSTAKCLLKTEENKEERVRKNVLMKQPHPMNAPPISQVEENMKVVEKGSKTVEATASEVCVQSDSAEQLSGVNNMKTKPIKMKREELADMETCSGNVGKGIMKMKEHFNDVLCKTVEKVSSVVNTNSVSSDFKTSARVTTQKVTETDDALKSLTSGLDFKSKLLERVNLTNSDEKLFILQNSDTAASAKIKKSDTLADKTAPSHDVNKPSLPRIKGRKRSKSFLQEGNPPIHDVEQNLCANELIPGKSHLGTLGVYPCRSTDFVEPDATPETSSLLPPPSPAIVQTDYASESDTKAITECKIKPELIDLCCLDKVREKFGKKPVVGEVIGLLGYRRYEELALEANATKYELVTKFRPVELVYVSEDLGEIKMEEMCLGLTDEAPSRGSKMRTVKEDIERVSPVEEKNVEVSQSTKENKQNLKTFVRAVEEKKVAVGVSPETKPYQINQNFEDSKERTGLLLAGTQVKNEHSYVWNPSEKTVAAVSLARKNGFEDPRNAKTKSQLMANLSDVKDEVALIHSDKMISTSDIKPLLVPGSVTKIKIKTLEDLKCHKVKPDLVKNPFTSETGSVLTPFLVVSEKRGQRQRKQSFTNLDEEFLSGIRDSTIKIDKVPITSAGNIRINPVSTLKKVPTKKRKLSKGMDRSSASTCSQCAMNREAHRELEEHSYAFRFYDQVLPDAYVDAVKNITAERTKMAKGREDLKDDAAGTDARSEKRKCGCLKNVNAKKTKANNKGLNDIDAMKTKSEMSAVIDLSKLDSVMPKEITAGNKRYLTTAEKIKTMQTIQSSEGSAVRKGCQGSMISDIGVNAMKNVTARKSNEEVKGQLLHSKNLSIITVDPITNAATSKVETAKKETNQNVKKQVLIIKFVPCKVEEKFAPQNEQSFPATSSVRPVSPNIKHETPTGESEPAKLPYLKIYKCSQCSYTSRYEPDLEHHQRSGHPKVKVYEINSPVSCCTTPHNASSEVQLRESAAPYPTVPNNTPLKTDQGATEQSPNKVKVFAYKCEQANQSGLVTEEQERQKI